MDWTPKRHISLLTGHHLTLLAKDATEIDNVARLPRP